MKYVRSFWSDWSVFHAIPDQDVATLCGVVRARTVENLPSNYRWATISDSVEEAEFYKSGSRLCKRCEKILEKRKESIG